MAPTLSLYIARHFFMAILLALGGLIAVIGLLNTVELIRRVASRPDVPFTITMEMALLKLPYMVQRILPFAVLIGSMIALIRLTRSSELVVARASGVSVWQFLRPAWLTALLIGVFYVAVVNPIGAAMLARFESLEARYISGKPSLLAISNSGLWLRDMEGAGPDERDKGTERIFHAMRMSPADFSLHDVIIFRYDAGNHFSSRIDAQEARLQDHQWMLKDVILSEPGKPPVNLPAATLATDLTLQQIQDSFASPETLSFWELPGFIRLLEEAGFSALRHKLYWQTMLISPVMLVGMVFLAAAFSLRSPRRGKVAALAVTGLMTGFAIYFVSDLIYALGLSASLPVMLAAWIPACAVLMAGIWLMIHLEHG